MAIEMSHTNTGPHRTERGAVDRDSFLYGRLFTRASGTRSAGAVSTPRLISRRAGSEDDPCVLISRLRRWCNQLEGPKRHALPLNAVDRDQVTQAVPGKRQF